jgi:hypothetical protein
VNGFTGWFTLRLSLDTVTWSRIGDDVSYSRAATVFDAESECLIGFGGAPSLKVRTFPLAAGSWTESGELLTAGSYVAGAIDHKRKRIL